MSMKATEKDYISLKALKAIKKKVHDRRLHDTIKQNQELRKLGKKIIMDLIESK